MAMEKADYDLPELKEIFVNTETKKTSEFKDLTPLERMDQAATKSKIELKSPDKNCKYPGCFGKGYTGINLKSQMPIPCLCIFLKKMLSAKDRKAKQKNMVMPSRTMFRKLERMDVKRRKKERKLHRKLALRYGIDTSKENWQELVISGLRDRKDKRLETKKNIQDASETSGTIVEPNKTTKG